MNIIHVLLRYYTSLKFKKKMITLFSKYTVRNVRMLGYSLESNKVKPRGLGHESRVKYVSNTRGE